MGAFRGAAAGWQVQDNRINIAAPTGARCPLTQAPGWRRRPTGPNKGADGRARKFVTRGSESPPGEPVQVTRRLFARRPGAKKMIRRGPAQICAASRPKCTRKQVALRCQWRLRLILVSCWRRTLAPLPGAQSAPTWPHARARSGAISAPLSFVARHRNFHYVSSRARLGRLPLGRRLMRPRRPGAQVPRRARAPDPLNGRVLVGRIWWIWRASRRPPTRPGAGQVGRRRRRPRKLLPELSRSRVWPYLAASSYWAQSGPAREARLEPRVSVVID